VKGGGLRMSFSQVFDTMFRLGFAILIGYVLNKMRIINAHTNKGISGIIVNVSNPALVIYAVAGQQQVNAEVMKLIGFGAVLYLLLPLTALAAVLLLRAKRDERGVYQMLLVFGNIIFMGFPIVQVMYGDQAILYLNFLNLPFTLLIFTYGVRLLRGKQSDIGSNFTVKDLLTPGFLSALFSLAVYITRLKIPTFLVNALGFIGGLTTPLSMIVLGSMMAAYSFRDILAAKKLYLLSFIKLIVMPAAGYLLARLLFSDPVLVGVITVSLAMPSAALCAMLGEQYGTEGQAGLTAQGVFITTILSMVSIPVVIFALT
jgi:predicted permease